MPNSLIDHQDAEWRLKRFARQRNNRVQVENKEAGEIFKTAPNAEDKKGDQSEGKAKDGATVSLQ